MYFTGSSNSPDHLYENISSSCGVHISHLSEENKRLQQELKYFMHKVKKKKVLLWMKILIFIFCHFIYNITVCLIYLVAWNTMAVSVIWLSTRIL